MDGISTKRKCCQNFPNIESPCMHALKISIQNPHVLPWLELRLLVPMKNNATTSAMKQAAMLICFRYLFRLAKSGLKQLVCRKIVLCQLSKWEEHALKISTRNPVVLHSVPISLNTDCCYVFEICHDFGARVIDIQRND